MKTLVLSHLVPPDYPDITDQLWIDAARKQFKKVRRQMKKLSKTTRRAIRLDRLNCSTGLGLMDLAAGIELNARRAARGS